MSDIVSDAPFSGSYTQSDVLFLLRRLQMRTTCLAERERMIQSGTKHYSEMIGPEDAPSRERMHLFRSCLMSNGSRMANDIAKLADALLASVTDDTITIVSIARAGTPIGVLLVHRLRRIAPHLTATHYSISVIRDRGADLAAIHWILERHSEESIRFVDGWTGKGTIASELKKTILAHFHGSSKIQCGLWVPLDVCGAATFAASVDDYLIPSTLLGGTISGLVSRSVMPAGSGDNMFHGCVYLDALKKSDLSCWFVNKVSTLMNAIPPGSCATKIANQSTTRQHSAIHCINEMRLRHSIPSNNQVKVGIGETVRVLLRRLPHIIYISDKINECDLKIIYALSNERSVPVVSDKTLLFDAVAIIANAT